MVNGYGEIPAFLGICWRQSGILLVEIKETGVLYVLNEIIDDTLLGLALFLNTSIASEVVDFDGDTVISLYGQVVVENVIHLCINLLVFDLESFLAILNIK